MYIYPLGLEVQSSTYSLEFHLFEDISFPGLNASQALTNGILISIRRRSGLQDNPPNSFRLNINCLLNLQFIGTNVLKHCNEFIDPATDSEIYFLSSHQCAAFHVRAAGTAQELQQGLGESR